MKITHIGDYRARRRDAFPSVGEQLDEIWRVIDAISNGGAVPRGAIDMLNQIKATKARIPKLEKQK